MAGFGSEEMAVDWLHERFKSVRELDHLRARKRGRTVTLESGPTPDVVAHVRFRRDTVHLWFLEMPARGGRWETTPYRDTLPALMELLEDQFSWTLAPIDP
jgi:hypothetical protein